MMALSEMNRVTLILFVEWNLWRIPSWELPLIPAYLIAWCGWALYVDAPSTLVRIHPVNWVVGQRVAVREDMHGNLFGWYLDRCMLPYPGFACRDICMTLEVWEHLCHRRCYLRRESFWTLSKSSRFWWAIGTPQTPCPRIAPPPCMVS